MTDLPPDAALDEPLDDTDGAEKFREVAGDQEEAHVEVTSTEIGEAFSFIKSKISSHDRNF